MHCFPHSLGRDVALHREPPPSPWLLQARHHFSSDMMIKLRAYFYEAHAVDVVEAEQQAPQ